MPKQKGKRRVWLKIVLPVVVLVMAIGLARIMVAMKPVQEKKTSEAIYPRITVHEVQPLDEQIIIQSQGTVRPRRQTRLTSRVSGNIEFVAHEFYEGGSFDKGDTLLLIDPLPYEGALAESLSRLALAESIWLQEKEQAEQAVKDWASIGEGEPSALVKREPQIAKAAADLEAAKVAVEMAQRNLNYTEIVAPYSGRVLSKFVDLGQAIAAQATILGEVYATDSAEVSVPLSQDDLAFVDTGISKQGSNVDKPRVSLWTELAGTRHKWDAWLDRTAAAINQQSRMIAAIVRIDEPFISNNGQSLKPGMFVQAEIEGRPIAGALRVPRAAIQPGDIVYRLTPGNRLESVHLSIVRTNAQSAIITNGLKPGDQLCMTPLLFFVEGMQVEIQDSPSLNGTQP